MGDILVRLQVQKESSDTVSSCKRRRRRDDITWALKLFLAGEELPENVELLLQAIASHPAEIDNLLTVRIQQLSNKRVLQREKLP